METLSERCSHVTQISGVNREAEQKRMCREDGRRDVDEMCGETAVGSAVIARKLYVHVFFSRYPPLPSPSVLLCFSTHYTHLSAPSSQCVLQIPLFIPSSLSLAWEAGAHSIYHPPVWVHLIKRTHLRTWPPLLRIEPDISELTEADKYSISISLFQI